MPRIYVKRFDEEKRRQIGDAVVAARPIARPQRDPRNTPWRDLEARLGYKKFTLWKLWREALARRRRPRSA